MATTQEIKKTDQAEMPVEQPQDEQVRIYNQGQGALVHDEHRSNPGQFVNVPKHIADLWMRLYPDRIVSAEDASKNQKGLAAKLDEANEEINRLRAELDKERKARIQAEEIATSPKSGVNQGGSK